MHAGQPRVRKQIRMILKTPLVVFKDIHVRKEIAIVLFCLGHNINQNQKHYSTPKSAFSNINVIDLVCIAY
jgi:hypothetical protein